MALSKETLAKIKEEMDYSDIQVILNQYLGDVVTYTYWAFDDVVELLNDSGYKFEKEITHDEKHHILSVVTKNEFPTLGDDMVEAMQWACERLDIKLIEIED